MMEGIGIALALAAIFGALFYGLRVMLVREPIQMKKFLDRRYDVIRRKGFWGEQRDYIDESMIQRWGRNGWGRNGWGFIPLPVLNLSIHLDHLWSLGGVSSILLLMASGMLFGDSRAAVRFMRVLGMERYQRQAQPFNGGDGETPRS